MGGLQPLVRGARNAGCAFLIALAFGPASARADCIDQAAEYHGVNTYILRAIGWHESRLRPNAVNRNANGTLDIGAWQINTIHLPTLERYGVTAHTLRDGCAAAYVGAWHYRRQIDELGNSWSAVGAYHSRTPARRAWYANAIARILMNWGVIPTGPLPYTGVPLLAPNQPNPGSPAPASARAPATRVAETTTIFDASAAP